MAPLNLHGISVYSDSNEYAKHQLKEVFNLKELDNSNKHCDEVTLMISLLQKEAVKLKAMNAAQMQRLKNSIKTISHAENLNLPHV